MEKVPSIFQRYGESCTENDKEMLSFLSSLFNFILTPDSLSMNKLASHPKFNKFGYNYEDKERTLSFFQKINPNFIYYVTRQQKELGDSTFFSNHHFTQAIQRSGDFATFYHDFLINDKNNLDSLQVIEELNKLKSFMHNFEIDLSAKNIETEKIKLEFPEYIDEIADSLYREKKYSDAIPLYNKILELYPYDYWALSDISYCYRELKNYDKALEFAFVKKKYWNHEPWAHRDLANIYSRMNDYKNGYLQTQILIEKEPKNYSNWFNSSFYALFVNKPEEAIASAQKTLELNPKALGVETNLALGYLMSDQFDKAEELYLKWKGKSFPNEDRLCDDIFLEDITALEGYGINHPDFEKVKKMFKK
jgi:tetratricopeptide (TPR) repeat protein